MRGDLQYALRCRRRAPSFTASASLTLALGMAAATAMFAVVHGVLLEELPYGESARLVPIRHESRGASGWLMQTPASYVTYRTLARSLENIGLYRVGTGNVWVGEALGQQQPEQVEVGW